MTQPFRWAVLLFPNNGTRVPPACVFWKGGGRCCGYDNARPAARVAALLRRRSVALYHVFLRSPNASSVFRTARDRILCGAVPIDGPWFRDRQMMVALGISIDGRKTVLGQREGATENAAVVGKLLSELAARGLDFSVPRLYVLDGGEGCVTYDGRESLTFNGVPGNLSWMDVSAKAQSIHAVQVSACWVSAAECQQGVRIPHQGSHCSCRRTAGQ